MKRAEYESGAYTRQHTVHLLQGRKMKEKEVFSAVYMYYFSMIYHAVRKCKDRFCVHRDIHSDRYNS